METLVWIDTHGHIHTMHKIDETSKTDEVKADLDDLGWPNKYVHSEAEYNEFVLEHQSEINALRNSKKEGTP